MRHDLGSGATGGRSWHLAPLDPRHADALGTAFAAMSPWVDYPFPASGLAAYFAKDEPGAPRYQIMTGDEVAGVVGLRLDWLRGPYLQFLGLLPPHQGHGVGARVLAWFEANARDGGQRNLWVAASDFNLAALHFYARHGFSECARLDGLVSDGRTEILMRKRLA